MSEMAETNAIPSSLQLPLRFDAETLARDVDALGPADWTPHFNTSYFEGTWTGVPLIGPAGETHPIRQLHPEPGCKEFEATEILGRCPNLRAVLDRFDCTIQSARLLRLGGGAHIREHTDHDLGFEDGEVRLHLPIQTDLDVEFVLDGERIVMNPGELWYLNVNLPHEVINRGTLDRTHLVVDCEVNEWLAGLFSEAQERA
jgi:hypothetical protein